MAKLRGRPLIDTQEGWDADPTYVLPVNEYGLVSSTGEFRMGDGETPWSELTAINLPASDTTALMAQFAALSAAHEALATRVSAIENEEPPPPANSPSLS
jgi:hypothetical protein